MKLLLLLIISASMLIEGLVNADGYMKDSKGCKMNCPTGYCNRECKKAGGYYGYCFLNGFSLGCWCEGLPADKTWKRGVDC
uniref:Putative depressant toxin Tx438 n=1 Tax=Buthus israelis TaxID=2899555 RepID=B8XH12_BUTIS|nr:putative depressant toxin Tx438 [Buthus occitanus israelis]